MTRSVQHLSSARRNIGAATVGMQVVMAGGCNTTGGGNTAFICNSADPAVDIFDASGMLNRCA